MPIAAAGFDRGNSGLAKDVEPWVTVISSVVKNGKPVGGLGSYELVWHTDMSYNPLPPRASLLYALEVPPDGGNTGFLNMYAAYETLPPELKRAIDGRTCIHDSSRNSAGELRKGFQRTLDVRHTPGAVHPLVRLHPVTQRKALFLGRRPGAYIHGLPVEESETAPRCGVGPRHDRALRLVSEVAERRPGDVGQSLRHAPPRRLRREPASAHAPHADRRRARAGGLDASLSEQSSRRPLCGTETVRSAERAAVKPS